MRRRAVANGRTLGKSRQYFPCCSNQSMLVDIARTPASSAACPFLQQQAVRQQSDRQADGVSMIQGLPGNLGVCGISPCRRGNDNESKQGRLPQQSRILTLISASLTLKVLPSLIG